MKTTQFILLAKGSDAATCDNSRNKCGVRKREVVKKRRSEAKWKRGIYVTRVEVD